MRLKPGDRVEVTFVDLAGAVGDDSTDATVPVGRSMGYFSAIKSVKGIRTLVLETTAWDEKGFGTGWSTYPMDIVRKVEVMR
jgi:hypothetical protein